MKLSNLFRFSSLGKYILVGIYHWEGLKYEVAILLVKGVCKNIRILIASLFCLDKNDVSSLKWPSGSGVSFRNSVPVTYYQQFDFI